MTALRCGRRPPPGSGAGDHTRGLRHRVVHRGLAKRRLDVIQRALEHARSEVNGVTRSRRVSKREHRRLVVRPERAEDVPRRLPRIDRLRSDAHAAADIEKYRHLHRAVRLGAKIENRSRLPGFGDDEVGPTHVGHESAFAVLDHRTDRDDVDRGPERGRRALRLRRLGVRCRLCHCRPEPREQ